MKTCSKRSRTEDVKEKQDNKNITEEELVRRCIANERQYQELLYRKYADQMYSVCLSYNNNEDEDACVNEDDYDYDYDSVCDNEDEDEEIGNIVKNNNIGLNMMSAINVTINSKTLIITIY